MKLSPILKNGLVILSILIASCENVHQADGGKSQETEILFPKGDKIMNGNFTGTAYLHPMIAADSLNPTDVGNVTFEPGARSKWHLHPGGQILLAAGGVGYYQEKDQPKIILRKGDAIKCPPNVPHWHGASPDTAFFQVAITSRANGPTVWLEAVSDSVYHLQNKQ